MPINTTGGISKAKNINREIARLQSIALFAKMFGVPTEQGY